MLNTKLSDRQKNVIEKFKADIKTYKLWNEDKIYVGYFIDALLAENYWWAANVWFVFIEKYLRTKLLFIRHTKSGKPSEQFLSSLDYEESLLENWEDWWNVLKQSKNNVINCLNKLKIDDTITSEKLLEEVHKYIELVDDNWPLPQNQLSFNNICNELKKESIFTKKESQELIKLYSKYRNPLQHWLFKRLIDQEANNATTPVVQWGIPWRSIELLEVDSSNLILRECWIIDELLKEISLLLFNKINELLVLLGDKKF